MCSSHALWPQLPFAFSASIRISAAASSLFWTVSLQPHTPCALRHWPSHAFCAPRFKAQRYLLFLVGFSILWVWFFHMGVFVTTISGAVSEWYFYRNDPDNANTVGRGVNDPGWGFGRPILLALSRNFRFHVGSLALGSFALALIKAALACLSRSVQFCRLAGAGIAFRSRVGLVIFVHLARRRRFPGSASIGVGMLQAHRCQIVDLAGSPTLPLHRHFVASGSLPTA